MKRNLMEAKHATAAVIASKHKRVCRQLGTEHTSLNSLKIESKLPLAMHLAAT